MTREFFGRLVKIFDGFRRDIDLINDLSRRGMSIADRRGRLQEKFDLIMVLLDVQHTDSPLWTEMALGEQIERMYLLCKAEYDSTQPLDNAAFYHRPIDLGDLHGK